MICITFLNVYVIVRNVVNNVNVASSIANANRWSCLPKAFSLATSIPFEEFIKTAGHDGSAILWPTLVGNCARRAFHPQEMFDLLLNKGFTVTEIERKPLSLPHGLDESEAFTLPNAERRFKRYLNNYSGVLIGRSYTGNPHAVAWDHTQQLVNDPNGTSYSISMFSPISLYVVMPYRAQSNHFELCPENS
jgi:hypothetical protein